MGLYQKEKEATWRITKIHYEVCFIAIAMSLETSRTLSAWTYTGTSTPTLPLPVWQYLRILEPEPSFEWLSCRAHNLCYINGWCTISYLNDGGKQNNLGQCRKQNQNKSKAHSFDSLWAPLYCCLTTSCGEILASMWESVLLNQVIPRYIFLCSLPAVFVGHIKQGTRIGCKHLE